MRMNQRSLNVLEYPKILKMLEKFCVTDKGKEKATHLYPMTESVQVEEGLDLTEEALEMILRNGRPPLAPLSNIADYVHRASIGSMLSLGELLNIAATLRIAKDMENYYFEDTQQEKLKVLKSYFDSLDPCYDLEEEISEKIISSEEMADNASRELATIRKEIVAKNARITEKLNAIISSSSNEKVLQDRLITVRNNRYVVPVKQEYRHKIPGIVLDKSTSGATIFIEPISVVELNNELKLLAGEEEKEITRILKKLTEVVAAYQLSLNGNFDILTELDFIFAKGKLGIEMGGVRVHISKEEPLHYIKARHPLIDSSKAVSSDIIMTSDINSIIITGPNTGGKTVTLKTIGLLNLMVQSGLFVPVKEKSHTRIYDKIFADIGDEQSIEQSLSTFSAHMKNTVEIIKYADAHSLVLFDELGAGTDPTEGAALAIALLDNLYSRNVVTIATTHYSELKEYALVTPGIQNASVEFDIKTLRPTFRLLIGIPGKSNAFEIAKRLGLNNQIIEGAKKRVKNESVQFEETLEKIDEKRRQYDLTLQQIRKREADIEEKQKKIGQEMEANRKQCNKLLSEARQQSNQMIKKTQEKTESIYQQIRQIQEATPNGSMDNKQLEALRKGIKKQSDTIDDKYQQMTQKIMPKQQKLGKLEIGMSIHLNTINKDGEILELDHDGRAVVQIGPMKIKVAQKDLSMNVSTKKTTPQKRKKNISISSDERHVMNTRLDLRGRTAEEAVFMVEKMVSDAVVSGTHDLTIVHGKGTGKLRKVIQNYLKDNSFIENYRNGAPNEGGTGVTIIKL